jgi:hypothetical protein
MTEQESARQAFQELQEKSMIAYRCYLLGEDGKIKRSVVIESPSDAAAVEEAERRLMTYEYPMIEVWDKDRRVGIVGRPGGHAEMATQKSEERA